MRVSPKSAEVLAVQVLSVDSLLDVPWLKEPIEQGYVTLRLKPGPGPLGLVYGIRGMTAVYEGDWVIQGPAGALSVCPDVVFKLTYSRSAEEPK